MKHIDLFSGIGGFALAVDTVWPSSEHIFCDIDPYCRAVLQKHWPQSEIYENIRTLTNTSSPGTRMEIQDSGGQERQNTNESQSAVVRQGNRESFAKGLTTSIDLLTGGFPCQPFSHAGQRRGTADDRYLWPEMFRVIQEFAPEWVIAENVRGLVTWSEGLVLEQVCTDLEGEGYEIQPLIIPAVAVNAPHCRDRVWVVANRRCEYGQQRNSKRVEADKTKRSAHTTNLKRQNQNASDTTRGQREQRVSIGEAENGLGETNQRDEWDKNWVEVATELCGVDDGLSAELYGLKLSKAGHRRERLKALGNAIVPQVAIQIMEAIKKS